MESFATGLKRIQSAGDEAACEVEFDKQPYGFAVVFYRTASIILGNDIQDNTENTQDNTENTQDNTENTQDNTQDNTENTQDKILKYCTEPRSKREIAEFLGYKSIKSILKHMTQLLAKKQLLMTIPEKPNHRNQKYIAAGK